ncbi:sensor histidine kinase [Nocardia sp. NPDC051321]|uniref:sensor histidine kinase n=1 Tax=Nocardia sp. NPDC051321 TaxID=3364323 RepID=UPI0037AE5AFE
MTIAGENQNLPAALERTIYRIVQESLTNISRHAHAATASVRIDYRHGAVLVRVDDDGAAHPDSDPVHGVGILGMRERVTALGGRLHAGPKPAGGFSVHAELPVEPS